MRISRIIRKRIAVRDGSAETDVNAVFAVNVGEAGATETTASSRQHIVQRTRCGETHTTIRDTSTDAPPDDKEDT